MRFRKSSSVALRIVILIVFLLSSSYFVVQVHASEPSLIEIFNYLGFTNVSETNFETFSAGTYNTTLYAEFAGYCDENELSYYEVDTSIFNVIFTGPEGGSGYLSPPATKPFTADYQFGLSMLSSGPHRYFSEISKNPDGEQHAKVYRNLDDPNMFLIGFENQYGAGDRDYNDMVFSFECAHDLTVSAGVGGSTVPVPGVYTHPCDSSVLVEAVPDACYMFDHWELDGGNVGSVNPYSVLMDDDHSLHAVFAQVDYTLTITATAGGTTDPIPGVYSYPCGSSVQVEAIPDSCYVFDHWELDSVNVGSTSPYSVLMDDDHTLHAVFSQVMYDLTITVGAGGTTSPVPGTYSYACGSSVLVEAVPDGCYVFDHWMLDSVDVGSANPYTVLMDDDHSLHAVFAQVDYTLTITATAGGITDPIPGVYSYPCGSSVSVEAVPDSCYVFDHWLLDGVDVGSVNPYSVLMDDDHALHAVFTQISYDLTVSAGVGGTTSPVPGTYSHACISSVDITAIPDEGYRFDHWMLDGSPAGSANPISVLMSDNHDLEAVFAETHTLIITVSEGGTTDPSSGTYTYEIATNVVVEAVPSVGYLFDYWEFDGEDIGSENPITVYVGSSHALKAFFTPITYQLTITATSGGTTNPVPGTYTYGVDSSVEVTAIPDTDYVFDHWLLDGVDVGSVNPYSVLMDDDHALHAVFTRPPPSPSPVGGYSVSLTRPVAKTPLICYAMLLAIFGAVLSLIKRKRK